MSILKDVDWVRKSFMVPANAMSNSDDIRKELTDAKYKFTDTTLGGNFAINPPPQFCHNADVVVESKYSGSNGMGRYYSEALDDTGQLIHLRFGVPQYNSLTNFFFNFYSSHAGSIANKGRSPSSFFYLGRSIGFIVSLPFMPIIWAGQVVRFLAKKPASKFYYMKPTMPLYWSAVATMVNAIGVNMGVISRGMSAGETELRNMDGKVSGDPSSGKAEHSAWHKVNPGVWREDGGIDIYAMASKAQRLARVNRENVVAALEKSENWTQIKENINEAADKVLTLPESRGLEKALADYLSTENGRMRSQDNADTSEKTGNNFNSMADDASFVSNLVAELEDGSQFITLRVDHTGSVSESFTNSVGESDLAGKINGMSSSARSARFDMADGNIGDGMIAGTLTSIMSSVKEVAAGFLEEVSLSGLAAFGGSAFVDIPQVWQNSTASLPRSSYTIQLRTPYGAPMARFQNLMVPLSMILAGALPLSAGKQSYTSPFLCELYSQGKSQTRLGMIDSLSITRGVGNLGWTKDNQPLGIDVTFSVVDLSTILHMPISANIGVLGAAMTGAVEGIGAAADLTSELLSGSGIGAQEAGADLASLLSMSNFDDDNAYTDYLAVLGGLSLSSQIYPTNKLRLNRAKRAAAWEQWKSPAHHANWLGGTSMLQIVSAVSHVTDRE